MSNVFSLETTKDGAVWGTYGTERNFSPQIGGSNATCQEG